LSTQLKYPYRWGKTVVNEFVEKYARGTYFLAQMVNSSPGVIRHALIMTLCRGLSLKFEALKRMIKLLDSEEKDIYSQLDLPDRKLLYKYYLYLAEDDEIDARIEGEALDSLYQEKLF